MALSYPILYSDHWLDASAKKDGALSQGVSEMRDCDIEHGWHTRAYFQSTLYSANQRSLAIDRHHWDDGDAYSPSSLESVVLDLVNALTALTTTAQERSLLEDLLKRQLQPPKEQLNSNNQLSCGMYDRRVIRGSTQSSSMSSGDHDMHARTSEHNLFTAFGHWGHFVEASLHHSFVGSTGR
jgi:hypothetical protein